MGQLLLLTELNLLVLGVVVLRFIELLLGDGSSLLLMRSRDLLSFNISKSSLLIFCLMQLLLVQLLTDWLGYWFFGLLLLICLLWLWVLLLLLVESLL